MEPVSEYQDPGGGRITFAHWDRATDAAYATTVSDKCCTGGWPPQLAGFKFARGTKEASLTSAKVQILTSFTSSKVQTLTECGQHSAAHASRVRVSKRRAGTVTRI